MKEMKKYIKFVNIRGKNFWNIAILFKIAIILRLLITEIYKVLVTIHAKNNNYKYIY